MNDLINKIEDFLDGKLDPQEAKLFEQEIKRSQELAQAVSEYKTAKTLAANLIEQETRQQLQALKKPDNTLLLFVRIAAIDIVGIGGIYLLFYKDQTKELNPEEVYASLYVKPGSVSLRNEVEIKTSLDTAIYFFDNNQLKSSEAYFKSYLVSHPKDIIAMRYLSHLYLQSGLSENAKEILIHMTEISSDPYKTEAIFNLCIILLMENKISEARNYYHQIENSNLIPLNKKNKLKAYVH